MLEIRGSAIDLLAYHLRWALITRIKLDWREPMAAFAARPTMTRRPDKLPFASPHGILYALPASIVLWAGILIAAGVIR